MWDDGVVVPHPPIKRALEMTKSALEKAGHKGFFVQVSLNCTDLMVVIDWTPLKHGLLGNVTVKILVFIYVHHPDLTTLQREIFDAGSTEDIMVVTSATGEPIIATMELDTTDPIIPPIRPRPSGITAYQLWQLQKLRRDTRKEYLDHWEATASETGTGRPIDAIICPAAPYVAHPHGKSWSVFIFAEP